MKKKIILELKSKHILRAKEFADDRCPISIALKKKLGLKKFPVVGTGQCTIKGRIYEIKKPYTLMKYHFDVADAKRSRKNDVIRTLTLKYVKDAYSRNDIPHVRSLVS